MLNAGIIGLGVGEKHVLAYQKHSQVSVKSVCDFDQSKLDTFHSAFPKVDTFSNDQYILRDMEIDIISVASYDNYHAQQIIEAFKNGKHVMAEKPLCLSLEEMLRIKAAQKQNDTTKLSANHVLRANSRFARFKNDIKKGEFGEIFYLEGDYYWGRKSKLFEWRAEMDFFSIIYGAAIHMIDLVMWLIDSRPVSVQALGNDISSRNNNQKHNSFAVILLQFENGVIAKLTGNGGSVHPHFHGLKIFGSERTMIQHIEGAYYFDSSNPDTVSIPVMEPYPEKETRQKVIHSFIDSILDSSITPTVSEQDVYDVMSVCFAAEEARNTGQSAIIEYINS